MKASPFFSVLAILGSILLFPILADAQSLSGQGRNRPAFANISNDTDGIPVLTFLSRNASADLFAQEIRLVELYLADSQPDEYGYLDVYVWYVFNPTVEVSTDATDTLQAFHTNPEVAEVTNAFVRLFPLTEDPAGPQTTTCGGYASGAAIEDLFSRSGRVEVEVIPPPPPGGPGAPPPPPPGGPPGGGVINIKFDIPPPGGTPVKVSTSCTSKETIRCCVCKINNDDPRICYDIGRCP